MIQNEGVNRFKIQNEGVNRFKNGNHRNKLGKQPDDDAFVNHNTLAPEHSESALAAAREGAFLGGCEHSESALAAAPFRRAYDPNSME